MFYTENIQILESKFALLYYHIKASVNDKQYLASNQNKQNGARLQDN